jgi:ubiquinone biosynthesis protein
MGGLTSEDQNYLAQNFLAFFKRDYRKIAQLYLASGWIDPNTPMLDFETAIRTVCEPIFEQPLKDISFAASLLTLFQTAQQFNMEVQPQLLLLQKTLFNIEGLGKQLYPELNLWQTAQPFLEKWIKTQMGPAVRLKRLVEKLKTQVPEWLDRWFDVV